jgi:hypothetical protein
VWSVPDFLHNGVARCLAENGFCIGRRVADRPVARNGAGAWLSSTLAALYCAKVYGARPGFHSDRRALPTDCRTLTHGWSRPGGASSRSAVCAVACCNAPALCSRARYSMICKGLLHSRTPRRPRFSRAADSATPRPADVTAHTPAAERSLHHP